MDLSADDPRAMALVAAIRTGEVDTLQWMLRSEPSLAQCRIVDARGVSRTALHVVADWPGHFPRGARTVQLLIAAGADPDAPVDNPAQPNAPETPLHWAASSNDVAVLDALLDGGANIEAPGAIFTGGSAMSDAVVFAQWEAARRLFARGAATTLWQAAALGALDRVHAACDHDPPPSLAERTNALWHACRGGQLAVAQFLVSRGADVQWVGHDGKRPLDTAHESGVRPLIEWLTAWIDRAPGDGR